jgi:hypothetical protein
MVPHVKKSLSRSHIASFLSLLLEASRVARCCRLVACVVLVTAATSSFADDVAPVPPPNQDLQREELALKREELEFKKGESASLQKFEKWKAVGNILSIVIAALALGIPVWIAAINIRAQRKVADEQAKLQFQMKIAELAVTNSTNATQAKEKARALRNLFQSTSLIPPDFAERFDPKDFRMDYGHSKKTREELISLLAEHPSERRQILEDWYVLFRWDRWWVDPLLDIEPEKRRKLDALAHRLEKKEREINDTAANPTKS